MIKTAKDSLNDNSHAVLYKIAQSLDSKIPEYVLDGVPLTKEAASEVPDALFADVTGRRFPLTDRANVWLSGAYFAKTASDSYDHASYSRIAQRILKAAEVFGISTDVEQAMSKLAEEKIKEAEAKAEEMAKQAESCYGEPETGGFPMFTADQVKRACAYFDDNAYVYDWRRREKIARNIMRKVAEYGLTPSETVRKEAGFGFPRVDFLTENLLTRESELMRRGLSKMAGDMRRTIKIVCEADPEDLLSQLEPLREMISGSDELSGIDQDYGRRFLPPADFLFDIGDDEARRMKDDTVSLGGELLSSRALSELPRRIFEKVMGPSDVDGLFENGKMSPKKISITIIKMKPHVQKGLLDAIRDFTGNAGEDYQEDPIDLKDEKVDEVVDETGKDVTKKDNTKEDDQ